MRRLDHELVAQRREVKVGNDRLFDERWQNYGIRCVNTRADQLEMHGRFVFGPFGNLSRIDAEGMMFARPAMNGFKASVVLGTIKYGTKGIFTFIKASGRLEKVLGSDLPEGESLFVAGTLDHLHEIQIILPVPWQAEVIMHKIIISG